MPDMTKGHVWHARATSSESGYGDPRGLVTPCRAGGTVYTHCCGAPFPGTEMGPESGYGDPRGRVTGAWQGPWRPESLMTGLRAGREASAIRGVSGKLARNQSRSRGTGNGVFLAEHGQKHRGYILGEDLGTRSSPGPWPGLRPGTEGGRSVAATAFP